MNHKIKERFDALFKKPLHAEDQADPNRSAVVVAQEYLNVPEKKRAIKNTVPPPPKSLRQEYGYSRRDVVAILNKIEGHRQIKKQGLLLPNRDTKSYREFAAGNETMESLAQAYNLSVVACKVFIEGIEKTIIDEAVYLRKRFGVKITDDLIHTPDVVGTEAEDADANESILNDARANDQKDVGASGGASIGGRIISRGKDSKGKPLALDSFERGGKLSEDKPGPGEESNTSRQVEHDDYSEESSA